MARSSSTSKAAHWTEIIRKYRRSGLAQSRFCQEHGVSYHSLRWWLRRLREEVTADFPCRRKPKAASPKPLEPEAPRFLPVCVIEAEAHLQSHDQSGGASAPIQILLPGGQRIAVGPAFDPETLRRVIAALEVPGC